MKKQSIAAVRFVWRSSIAPILRRLPGGWGARLHTLAHYAKMTLLHGHTIHFEPSGNPPPAEPAPPAPAQGGNRAGSTPLKKRPNKKPRSVVPDFAIEELRALEQIEPELAPTPHFLSQFHIYTPPVHLEPARVYAHCSAELAEIQPDIILLVPWLVRGGADLGALLHAQAAQAAGHKVVMISTLNADSPWKHRVPPGAGFIEFGRYSSTLTDSQRQEVLVRLLLDSPAKVIHVINSHLGWEIVRRYGKSLTGIGKRIYASAFSDGKDDQGVMWSYPRFFFVECWRYLSGVICDSQWYPDDLVRQYGIHRERLHTAYFPMIPESTPAYRARTNDTILWASRITYSKRPDLLIGIAKAMPHIRFDVFGYTDAAERHYEAELRALPNIALRGKYDSLEAIAQQGNYSAFLYTSAWDGLPNVLLEATAAGLPVVASAICGVPEFINETTGYPVFDVDNAGAYVARLQEALGDATTREQKWLTACQLLATQHSNERFLTTLHAIPGYFPLDDTPPDTR